MLKKKNNNKKIVIYKALMLPLMTMFLLNIGLIATTWAWYTASISSGVNSIKAGVDVSVEVSKEGLDDPIAVQNNSVSLEANSKYKFTFTHGSAANGYYALITVSNSTVATNPITNLFMTTAYAESEGLYAVEIPAENPTKEIIMQFEKEKHVAITYIWNIGISLNENNQIGYNDVTYSVVTDCIPLQSNSNQVLTVSGTDDNQVPNDEQDTEANESTPGIISGLENEQSESSDESILPAEDITAEGRNTVGNESATETITDLTIPVQIPDQSTTTSEEPTNPSTEPAEGQSNTETRGEEVGVQAEMKTEGQEVDAYAQSE